MAPRRPHSDLATLLVAASAALAGCGGADDRIGREPVSGTVTLDGKPLPSGSVTLLPTGDGPAVGATIDRGSFAIARPDGPAPGTYRVEVVSVQPTGRTVPDPEGPRGSRVEETKDAVPDRYNLRSGLTAVVTRGGPNAFAFDLSSSPDRPPSRGRRR